MKLKVLRRPVTLTLFTSSLCTHTWVQIVTLLVSELKKKKPLKCTLIVQFNYKSLYYYCCCFFPTETLLQHKYSSVQVTSYFYYQVQTM